MHEESDPQPQDFHVGERLGLMHGMQAFHAFDLDEDFVTHHEVRAMLACQAPLVQHRHTDLPRVSQSRVGELDTERLFVRRLEQTGAKVAMHFDRAADDPVSQGIVVVRLFSRCVGASVFRLSEGCRTP